MKPKTLSFMQQLNEGEDYSRVGFTHVEGGYLIELLSGWVDNNHITIEYNEYEECMLLLIKAGYRWIYSTYNPICKVYSRFQVGGVL